MIITTSKNTWGRPSLLDKNPHVKGKKIKKNPKLDNSDMLGSFSKDLHFVLYKGKNRPHSEKELIVNRLVSTIS